MLCDFDMENGIHLLSFLCETWCLMFHPAAFLMAIMYWDKLPIKQHHQCNSLVHHHYCQLLHPADSMCCRHHIGEQECYCCNQTTQWAIHQTECLQFSSNVSNWLTWLAFFHPISFSLYWTPGSYYTNCLTSKLSSKNNILKMYCARCQFLSPRSPPYRATKINMPSGVCNPGISRTLNNWLCFSSKGTDHNIPLLSILSNVILWSQYNQCILDISHCQQFTLVSIWLSQLGLCCTHSRIWQFHCATNQIVLAIPQPWYHGLSVPAWWTSPHFIRIWTQKSTHPSQSYCWDIPDIYCNQCFPAQCFCWIQ